MDLLLKFLRLDWWVYVIAVVTFFSVALFLNYVVKKINEARLEERLIKIQNKPSNSLSIQARRRAESRLLPRSPLEIVLEQSNPPTVKGISLVFGGNDHPNERNNDYIDIKNFPKSNCNTTANVTDKPAENEVMEKRSEDALAPPSLLGKIYKELSIVEKSKSLSNADRNVVKEEIAKIIDSKKPESKSAPSVKKLLDHQMDEDFKKWSPKIDAENVILECKATESSGVVKY